MGSLELGEVAGTSKVSLAEGNAGARLTLAAFEADVSVVVGDIGQFAQGLGEVDGAVFTVAVVEGVGSHDSTVVQGIDGLVQGPSTADSVVGTIGSGVSLVAVVSTVGGNQDSGDTEGVGKSGNVGAGVGAEDVEDGEALSNLSQVDTRTEGSLVGQLADTSAAGIADRAGRAGGAGAADGRVHGAGAGVAGARVATVAGAGRAVTTPGAGAGIATEAGAGAGSAVRRAGAGEDAGAGRAVRGAGVVGMRLGWAGSNTLADGQQLSIARGSSSDGTSAQLEASATIRVTVPAGNPTSLTSGEESRDLVNGSSSQGSELLTVGSAGSDSLSVRLGVRQDVENLTSSERGQNGKQSSSRRNHCCVWSVDC